MQHIHKPLLRQTALVTGASSGIGQAIAIALAQAGANVLANYNHDEKGAKETLKAIEQSEAKGIIYKADISSEADVLAMFAAAKKEFGTIDILINNAGIQKDGKFSELTLEKWREVIDTDLTGQFLCAREAAREFLARGLKDYSKAVGKVIFISSVHNIIPWAGHVNYAASKGGETMLMESMAQELAPQKIRINAIAPGAIKTDINKEVWSDPKKMKDLMKLIPYNRLGEPEDVAKAVVWLASDEADYVTGTTLYVDGGMTLYPSFSSNG